MEETQVALARILTKVESDLRLPDRFVLDLLEETDWAFIIKAHALLEAAVTQALTAEIDDHRIHQIIKSLNLVGRHSKLAYARALGLLEPSHQRFLEHFSQLRNTVVHDVAQVRFSFEEYFDSLQAEEQNALISNLLFIGPKDPARAAPQLRTGARMILWLHVVAILAVCVTRQVTADSRRTVERDRRELAEKILGVKLDE